MFVADLKNSWKFSLSPGEISLLTELQRVSNSNTIPFFIYLFLSTKHRFELCPKGEISFDCRMINLLPVFYYNYKLIALVGDCANILFFVDNWNVCSFVRVFKTMLFKKMLETNSSIFTTISDKRIDDFWYFVFSWHP